MVVIRKGEMVGGEREEGRERGERRRVVGEELASWCEVKEGVMKKGES